MYYSSSCRLRSCREVRRVSHENTPETQCHISHSNRFSVERKKRHFLLRRAFHKSTDIQTDKKTLNSFEFVVYAKLEIRDGTFHWIHKKKKWRQISSQYLDPASLLVLKSRILECAGDNDDFHPFRPESFLPRNPKNRYRMRLAEKSSPEVPSRARQRKIEDKGLLRGSRNGRSTRMLLPDGV